MNKFLVTIVIPSVEMEFDAYIPNNKKIGTIKKYILASIYELSNHTFTKTEDQVRMIERKTGAEYDNDLYVKDAGIKNGAKIIFI